MKQKIHSMGALTIVLFFQYSLLSQSQPEANNKGSAKKRSNTQEIIVQDSIYRTLEFRQGQITLGAGIAILRTPPGFGFLDPIPSKFVLETLWGYPPFENCLGMLFPDTTDPIRSSAWAFTITFSEIGYVEDSDAEKIDYDLMLNQLKEATVRENDQKIKPASEATELIGWASKPFYDEKRKALHWANEYRNGNFLTNTLNYEIRLLGRKGILSMNAIGGMEQLEEVKSAVAPVMSAIEFSDGYRYEDFVPAIDNLAALGISELITGKTGRNTGIRVFIAEYWKLLLICFAGLAGLGFKWYRGLKIVT